MKTKSVEAARLSSNLESETVRPLGGKHLHLVDLTWIEQAEVLLRPLECLVLRGSDMVSRGRKFRFFARGEMPNMAQSGVVRCPS